MFGVNIGHSRGKLRKMNEARKWYQRLTGAEPKNLAVLGPETSRKLAEQFGTISGDLNYSPALMEMEFIKVKRTKDGYFVRLIDVHKREDGKYSGVNLDVGHVLLEEIGPPVNSLDIGDSATYCLKGQNISEIVRKRNSYIRGKEQPSIQKKLDEVLSGEHLTENQLVQNYVFKVKGNSIDGYVADVVVKNKNGLHARPSSLIVKTASKYAANVMIKKGEKTTSAKSMIGVLTLEAPIGTNLIFEADGEDAEECLEKIVALFEKKFDEE